MSIKKPNFEKISNLNANLDREIDQQEVLASTRVDDKQGGLAEELLSNKSFESLGFDNPEDLSYAQQESMAIELIDRGEVDFVLSNLSRMRQLSNEVAIRLVEAKPENEATVIHNEMSFKSLDYNKITQILIERGDNFLYIRDLISQGKGIDFSLVERFLEIPVSRNFVLNNLERFENVNRGEIIDKLIEEGLVGYMLPFFDEMSDQQLNDWLDKFSQVKSLGTAGQMCEHINQVPAKLHYKVAAILLSFIEEGYTGSDFDAELFFEELDRFNLTTEERFIFRFRALGLEIPTDMDSQEREYFASESSERIFLAKLATREKSPEDQKSFLDKISNESFYGDNPDEEFGYVETLMKNDFPGWRDSLEAMEEGAFLNENFQSIPGVLRLRAVSEDPKLITGLNDLAIEAREKANRYPDKKVLFEINWLKMGLAGNLDGDKGEEKRKRFWEKGLVKSAIDRMDEKEYHPTVFSEISNELVKLPEIENLALAEKQSSAEQQELIEGSFSKKVFDFLSKEELVDEYGQEIQIFFGGDDNGELVAYFDREGTNLNSLEEAREGLSKVRAYVPEVDGFVPVSVLFEFEGKSRASKEFLASAMEARQEVRLDQQFNLEDSFQQLRSKNKDFVYKGESFYLNKRMPGRIESGGFVMDYTGGEEEFLPGDLTDKFELKLDNGENIPVDTVEQANELFEKVTVRDEILGELKLKDYLRITENNYRGAGLGNPDQSAAQIMIRAREAKRNSPDKEKALLELRAELLGQFKKLGQYSDEAIERLRGGEGASFAELREQILTEENLKELSPEQVQRIEQGLYNFFQKKEAIEEKKEEIENDPKKFLEDQLGITLENPDIEMDFSRPGVISFGIKNKRDFAILYGIDISHEGYEQKVDSIGGAALLRGKELFKGVITIENLSSGRASNETVLEHEWRHQMNKLLMSEQGFDSTRWAKDEILAFLHDGLRSLKKIKETLTDDDGLYNYQKKIYFKKMKTKLKKQLRDHQVDPGYFQQQVEKYEKERKSFKNKVVRLIDIASQIKDREGNIDINLLAATPISRWKDLRKL